MNVENISLENVPAADIATWLAKVERIKFALKEQTMVSSEDGQAAYMLVDPDPGPTFRDHWTDPANRAEAYEAAIVYELEKGLSLRGLQNALELPHAETVDLVIVPTADKPLGNKELNARARRLGDQALLTGLGRLGMVNDSEDGTREAPDGLVGALMYRRADIHRASDRSLYERADEIDGIKEQIEQAAPPRGVQLAFTIGRGMMSVYRGVAYDGRDGVAVEAGEFGLTAPTKFGKWWEELGNDFERIDSLALSAAQE